MAAIDASSNGHATKLDFVPVTRASPCPICRKPNWCSVSINGNYCACRRIADGGLEKTDRSGNIYYAHRIGGTAATGNGEDWPEPQFSNGGENLADADTLNKVYSAFLSHLPLFPEHIKALETRGLRPDPNATSNPGKYRAGYRTLGKGRRTAVQKLIKAGLESLLPSVPGFFIKVDERGNRCWTVASMGGMIVPVRDAERRIIALGVRLDAPGDGGKYRYVTSRKYGGPSPGSPVHVPLFDGDTSTVRITEGALKADAATALSGMLTLGLPGVNAWAKAATILNQFGATTARIAFDADCVINHHVAESLSRLAEDLRDKGFTVELERWPMTAGKGIDDLLATGRRPDLVTGDAVAQAVAQIVEEARKADPPPAAARPAANGLANEADDDPHRLARVFLWGHVRDLTRTSAKVPAEFLRLRYHKEEWIEYDGAAYRPAPPKEIRARVTDAAKTEFDRINREKLAERSQRPSDAEGKEKPPPETHSVSVRLAGDVLQALTGLTLLPATIEPPAWLSGAGRFPADEVLATRNALVHLPSLVRRDAVHSCPPSLNFFSLNALDYDFDADAPAPATWLAFLRQLWPDDAQSIDTLQEWFGYLLTPDTRQQKILMIVGPRRSGKGTISRVLRALIGPANVAGPTLSSLASHFGLWPLLGKTAAIISDARLSGRSDMATIVERLLSISGEDALTVDRKNLTPVTTKLATRLVILTNELPRLDDASGAMPSRLILLHTPRTWYGQEDPYLTDRILAELPGILMWAVIGWQRLRERGRFRQPESGQEMLDEIEDLSSPVSSFIREHCVLSPALFTSVDDLFTRWKEWCAKQGRDKPGTVAVFGRNLLAAAPALKRARPGNDESRVRGYQGIGLCPAAPFP